MGDGNTFRPACNRAAEAVGAQGYHQQISAPLGECVRVSVTSESIRASCHYHSQKVRASDQSSAAEEDALVGVDRRLF